MIIGIDASRAFSDRRTGIEEYSFRVIKNLINELKNDQTCLSGRQVVLYVRGGQSAATADYPLPENWKIKTIKWPFFWTQLGLSLELLLHPVDALFVPSHVVPAIHPERTVVTIHGLEYEFFPEGYSFWERVYMRWSIKASCRWAKKIIAVSENTKKDLIALYKVPEEKIEVVYEGCVENPLPSLTPKGEGTRSLLFIGRLEARKNIIGIVKAFEILKEKYEIPHQLILAGKFSYGAEKIRYALRVSRYAKDIILPGFVSEMEKQELLQNAGVFLFPSFYEGFGLPILEAQSAGVPVVASKISSMPEVAGEGALLVDPKEPEEIAQAVFRLVSDKALRDDIIKKGYENAKRFSWEKCAKEIAGLF
jgi:glycosyltransferase involved in cell wall biosynthesis